MKEANPMKYKISSRKPLRQENPPESKPQEQPKKPSTKAKKKQ